MKKKLENLLKKSYSPYSKVKVAAIVISKNNDKFYGVNIENAAFPSTICAERNAIFNSVTNGLKPREIKEIHIMSNVNKNPLFPCGGCIQVMLEFCNKKSKILIYFKNEVKSYLLKELIPYGITSESFGWK